MDCSLIARELPEFNPQWSVRRGIEQLYAAFFHAMLREGVALAPGAYEALFVGLAHTDDVLDQIHTFRPTIFMGVPALYNAINYHPKVGQFDPSRRGRKDPVGPVLGYLEALELEPALPSLE